MSRLLIGSALVLFALPALAGDEVKAPTDEVTLLSNYLELSTAERRRLIAQVPREEQVKLLSQTAASDLLALGQKRVKELGAYKLRLTKEERVDGKLHAPQ